MSKLFLFMTKPFNATNCRVYTEKNDNSDFWMDQTNIGQALGYQNPESAIKRIHHQYKNTFDDFSRDVSVCTSSHGKFKTTLYSTRGLNEFCFRSHRPEAREFVGWIKSTKNEVHEKSIISFKEMVSIINSRLDLSVTLDQFMSFLRHAFYISSGNPTSRSMNLGIMNIITSSYRYSPYNTRRDHILDRGITLKGQKYFLNKYEHKVAKESAC